MGTGSVVGSGPATTNPTSPEMGQRDEIPPRIVESMRGGDGSKGAQRGDGGRDVRGAGSGDERATRRGCWCPGCHFHLIEHGGKPRGHTRQWGRWDVRWRQAHHHHNKSLRAAGMAHLGSPATEPVARQS